MAAQTQLTRKQIWWIVASCAVAILLSLWASTWAQSKDLTDRQACEQQWAANKTQYVADLKVHSYWVDGCVADKETLHTVQSILQDNK